MMRPHICSKTMKCKEEIAKNNRNVINGLSFVIIQRKYNEEIIYFLRSNTIVEVIVIFVAK